MKKTLRWVKIFILLYCIIGIAGYYLQDRLLFHPEPMDRKAVYHFEQPFKELDLSYDRETNLNIVQFKATDRVGDSLAKGVVLYFHGNAGNIGLCAKEAAPFTAKGYECWMMDYPGFGKSTGQFTEENLYKYALVFYKLARSRWNISQIIICGKGFGTGVAAQLAAVRDCRRLILESPYYSLTARVRHYAPIYPVGQMLHYHFPTNEFLPEVSAPVTIFDKDGDGARLKPLLKPGDSFISGSIGSGVADALTE